MAGLALPTAAAAAVTFGAAAAEVAMSTKPVSLGVQGQKATPGPTQQAASAATAAQARDRRTKEINAQAQAVTAFRANAAAQASRSAQRKSLAARALEAKREAQRAAQREAQREAQRAAQRAARAHGWQMPISNPVRTSGFGLRWGRMHEGQDFAVPEGTDLVSMSTGTVVFAGEESGFGNLVKIRYWDGTVTFYAHMSRISATEGEEVEPGKVVGQSGNSGHSTGPHLHLEIHPDGAGVVDPASWLADHKVGH